MPHKFHTIVDASVSVRGETRESKETNNNILKDTRKASIIERERVSLSLTLESRGRDNPINDKRI